MISNFLEPEYNSIYIIQCANYNKNLKRSYKKVSKNKQFLGSIFFSSNNLTIEEFAPKCCIACFQNYYRHTSLIFFNVKYFLTENPLYFHLKLPKILYQFIENKKFFLNFFWYKIGNLGSFEIFEISQDKNYLRYIENYVKIKKIYFFH